MKKLKVTLTFEVEVSDLSHFGAATIEEAAANQKKWLEDGTHGVGDLLSYGDYISVEVAPVDGVPVPVVGKGATICLYSDRKACTVIRVSDSGKTAWIQEDKAKLLNGFNSGEEDALHFEPGGFAGHTSGTQRWECTRDPKGPKYRVSRRKNGHWYLANSQTRVRMGTRDHYHDFNF
jgi:hypothetical protein